MSKSPNSSGKVKGLYFLSIVLTVYIFFYISAPDAAIEAFLKSVLILLNLLPILLVVLALLGVFNYFIRPKKLVKYLGKESGMRGWMIAVLGGVLSHGPSYIWYQMLSDMRSHGARDGLIVTFFYVRAIKLPWLPVMIDYFGWLFTAVLTIVLIVAGVIQGMIMDRFAKLAE